jgi:uncharacterized membrane protein YkoI
MNALHHDPVRTARRVSGLAVLPILAALVLVGCSAGQPGSIGPSGGSDAGGSAGAAAPDSAASNDALLAAVESARKAVDSGTVISVEQEQGASAHEVLLVTGDGNEHEVHTNAAGTAVAGSPRTERSDADDEAENARFVAAAELDVSDAVAAFEDLHAGTVTEIGLDDHLGKVVWEGEVRDSSRTEHSVRIDAGSGAVVTDAVDTDAVDTDG